MIDADLEVLAYEPSPIGMICLRRRTLAGDPASVVTEITVDHEFLMSSHCTDSERALARRALELHEGTQLDVLVGGLGLGYTAREALASDRVARVEVLELLPQVIDWMRRGLVPLSRELSGDARLELVEADVYDRLFQPPRSPRRHDLILIDVDHSPDEPLGEQSAAFYSLDGLARAREHLAPGGVLAVWSYAECPALAERLRSVFAQAHVEPVHFRNAAIDADETNWLFFARC